MSLIANYSEKRNVLHNYLALMTGDEKHEPSSLSTLDVLWVLYETILNINPASINDDNRDRFFLSKGHGPQAYYAILALNKFIPEDILDTYGEYNSSLGYHPDRTKLECVEISSGSLGQGLALAIGSLIALKARNVLGPKHWVLIGDAELDEGSNAEAITFAGRNGLSDLNVVVIDNDSSTLGWPGGIAKRFITEGWEASLVDGRNHSALYDAFKRPHPDRPHVIIANVETKTGSPHRNY